MMCKISQYFIWFQRSWCNLDCSAQRFVQNCYHSYRYVFIRAHPSFEPLSSTGWPTLIRIICATSLDNVFSHSFRGIIRLQSSSQQPLVRPGKHFSPWISLKRVVQICQTHRKSRAQLLEKSWTELSLLQTQNNAIFLAGAQDLRLWL